MVPRSDNLRKDDNAEPQDVGLQQMSSWSEAMLGTMVVSVIISSRGCSMDNICKFKGLVIRIATGVMAMLMAK